MTLVTFKLSSQGGSITEFVPRVFCLNKTFPKFSESILWPILHANDDKIQAFQNKFDKHFKII